MQDKEASFKDALTLKSSNRGVVAFHEEKHFVELLLSYLPTNNSIPSKDDYKFSEFTSKKHFQWVIKLKLISELDSLESRVRFNKSF